MIVPPARTCENCGGPLGDGGGYPPPGQTTATADPADAWCTQCALGGDDDGPSEGELERIAERVGTPSWWWV